MIKLHWYWYNFKTNKYDYRIAPDNGEEAIQYIPQLSAAQNLYKCHRELGKSILEALKEVLMACVPSEVQEDVNAASQPGNRRD